MNLSHSGNQNPTTVQEREPATRWSTMNAEIDWLALTCFALAGVVFVSVGQLIELLRYQRRGALTTGKVTKLEKKETSDGGPVFTPIIEYRVGKDVWRIESVIAMAPALYHEGQEVPVYYFPESPWNGRVVTSREFVKWIILAAGCLLFLAMLLTSRPE
jgi:hypothetical protein